MEFKEVFDIITSTGDKPTHMIVNTRLGLKIVKFDYHVVDIGEAISWG